ncbi:MAG: DNA translocase FtsK 4TM domain-containing protein, partial [Planctomycetota bacterium]
MARSSAKRRSRPADSDTGAGVAPKLIWLAAAAGWAFLAAALLGFDRADPPTHAVWPTNSPPANWCGPVGAWLAAHAFKLLGWAIWLPMLIAGAGLVWTLSGRRLAHPVIRTAGTVILTVAFAGLLGLANPSIAPWPELPGGIGGLVGATELTSRFGALGSALWMIALALVGFIVAFDRLAWAVPALVLRQLGVGLGKTAGAGSAGLAGAMGRLKAKRAHRENDLDIDPEDEYADEYEEDEYEEDEDEGEWEEDDAEYEDEYEDEEAEAEPEPEPVVVKKPRKDKKRVRANLEPKPEPAPVAVSAASVASLEEDEEEDDELPGAPQVFTEEQIKEKIAALPVRFAGANRQLASEEDLRDLQQMGDMEGYQFPTLDLLEDPEEDFNETLEQLVREQGEALEAALREYKIKGEVVGIESGPVITLYDVRLAPGTKVAQLTSVQSDLARALKAVNIRVVANQVGRDTVGIEVPNPTKERVRLKELMSSRDRFQKMKLPMFLGKDASGDPLIADLSEMPHMLIAGTTG